MVRATHIKSAYIKFHSRKRVRIRKLNTFTLAYNQNPMKSHFNVRPIGRINVERGNALNEIKLPLIKTKPCKLLEHGRFSEDADENLFYLDDVFIIAMDHINKHRL